MVRVQFITVSAQDLLNFIKIKNKYQTKPLSLEKINPIIFSEVVRDIDLFIAVAGHTLRWQTPPHFATFATSALCRLNPV